MDVVVLKVIQVKSRSVIAASDSPTGFVTHASLGQRPQLLNQ